MAAELPDFIESLVGIAQRGRSLGVHMILATQRPGGAVNDNIRANTNLRISLRVQEAAESLRHHRHAAWPLRSAAVRRDAATSASVPPTCSRSRRRWSPA